MNNKVYSILLQLAALPFGWVLATLWYNLLFRDYSAIIPLVSGAVICMYAAWKLENRKEDE